MEIAQKKWHILLKEIVGMVNRGEIEEPFGLYDVVLKLETNPVYGSLALKLGLEKGILIKEGRKYRLKKNED